MLPKRLQLRRQLKHIYIQVECRSFTESAASASASATMKLGAWTLIALTVTLMCLCHCMYFDASTSAARFQRTMLQFRSLRSAYSVRRQHTFSRTAYLLTIDDTTFRYHHSHKLLLQQGFRVETFIAPKHLDKWYSNRVGLLAILEKIAAKNEHWSYVFEDDINLVEDVPLLSSAKPIERLSDKFFYLGLCQDESWFLRRFTRMHSDVTCGTCAHAFAITPVGARELVQFADPELPPLARSFDYTMKEWCEHSNGFRLVRPDLESPLDSNQLGLVYQDRLQFPSTIDTA